MEILLTLYSNRVPLDRKKITNCESRVSSKKIGRNQCLHRVVLGCTRKADYHTESPTWPSNLILSLLLQEPFPQLKGWHSHVAFEDFFFLQWFSILNTEPVHLIRIRNALSWVDSLMFSMANSEKHPSKWDEENQAVWLQSPWTGTSCMILGRSLTHVMRYANCASLPDLEIKDKGTSICLDSKRWLQLSS